MQWNDLSREHNSIVLLLLHILQVFFGSLRGVTPDGGFEAVLFVVRSLSTKSESNTSQAVQVLRVLAAAMGFATDAEMITHFLPRIMSIVQADVASWSHMSPNLMLFESYLRHLRRCNAEDHFSLVHCVATALQPDKSPEMKLSCVSYAVLSFCTLSSTLSWKLSWKFSCMVCYMGRWSSVCVCTE